ncbi:MAG: hypothetical protein DMG30_17490 [Acidobacteria bacterium]|nr:MAG: hypothetical protein DMG30_17490 [Acidobacteriota bacterium]
MVPNIDGKLHHFSNAGLYDGLFVTQDAETKTLWNHITGGALYGPLVGRNLGPVGNLLQMNVKEALAMDPKMQVAISDRIYFAGGRQFGSAGSVVAGLANCRGNEPDPNTQMSALFVRTLGKEDERRPRMELGLGMWASATRRYHPMTRIRERGRAFIDQLDGRRILIYIDPETHTPATLFGGASSAKMKDNEVHLDNGVVLRDRYFSTAEVSATDEHPQQVFTRWYVFALTFPGCEIFGE